MMRHCRIFLPALALAAVALLPPSAGAGGRPLSADLTGAAEVPGPGDPDGSGVAKVRLNKGQGKVCVDFTVASIAPVRAAHIHRAPVGRAGPIVVPLPASGKGCVDAERRLVKEIRQNPSAFYVNVHTADFPAGALRGQLEK